MRLLIILTTLIVATIASPPDISGDQEKKVTFQDVLHLGEKEYDDAVSTIAILSITECGDSEPNECYFQVSVNVLNRLRIVRAIHKDATIHKVVSEPKQYSGWWDGEAGKKKGLSPAMYARNIKRAIDNAAVAINSSLSVSYGTCYLNPKYVKKKYGHLPNWVTDENGSLRKGKFVGSQYFIEENLGFYYNGKYIEP